MPLTARMSSYEKISSTKHLIANTEYEGCATRETATFLTFSRDRLKQIGIQTVDIGHDGCYVNRKGETVSIKEPLRRAVKGSKHYHSSHVFTPPPSSESSTRRFDTNIMTCYGSALQVASYLQREDTHVGILNSASGKAPDKFLRGTISPEECTCRATLLYPCLAQFEHKPHHFYQINNREKYMENNSACAIFSPHVPVIRQDDISGQLLDSYELCSFVSIPAANAFVVGKQEHEKTIPKAQPIGSNESGIPHEHISLSDATYDRIFRALCIFQENGCTDLVLGAFGCGVHGNRPETVAETFRKILNNEMKGHFRTIVFAIQPSRHNNYRAFTSIFYDAVAVQHYSELYDYIK